MSEDREADAEADGDGGEGREKYEIKAPRKTVGGGGCENLSGETVEHEKESRDGITGNDRWK